jgi:hypothetical protein
MRVSYFGEEACPVCERWLSEEPIVTVLIGVSYPDRLSDKARCRAAVVLVHARCAGVDGFILDVIATPTGAAPAPTEAEAP